MTRFKSKVALVMGGSTGIGAATTRAFAREGARVAIASDLSLDQSAPLREELRAEGADVRNYQCDISDAAAVARLIGAVKADFGRIDVAANCAGWAPPDRLYESDPEVARRVYEVNAIGPYYFVQALAPVMRDQGGGNIVLVASASGVLGTTQISAYCASKAGVIQLARGLVQELKGSRIRLNCIAPGLTRTPMTAWLDEDGAEAYREKLKSIIPSPYDDPWLEAGDQAEVILFLASDAAKAVHGHCILTDQGMTTSMPS